MGHVTDPKAGFWLSEMQSFNGLLCYIVLDRGLVAAYL